MKILLDTCTFLWAFMEDRKLSPKVHYLITDPENEVYLSATSLWEISIKYQLKKLDLGKVNILHLPNIAKQLDFQIINPQSFDYIDYVSLPLKENHRDPFDRMLIQLAIKNGYTLLSADQKFLQYKEDGLLMDW